MADPTWYVPVCDRILAKIQLWHDLYDRGEEAASRKWMTPNARIVDRTVKFGHRLKFKTQEIDHLVRILDALAEHKELADDFRRVRAGMKQGRLHPGGEYEIKLAFYKEDLVEILDALRRSKSGKYKTLTQVAEEHAKTGKGMFEV
jgi:hypothetical protein